MAVNLETVPRVAVRRRDFQIPAFFETTELPRKRTVSVVDDLCRVFLVQVRGEDFPRCDFLQALIRDLPRREVFRRPEIIIIERFIILRSYAVVALRP